MSPNAGEEGCGVSANEYSCTHGAQINYGDLTPYLTYASSIQPSFTDTKRRMRLQRRGEISSGNPTHLGKTTFSKKSYELVH
jgi:hypothetical protein